MYSHGLIFPTALLHFHCSFFFFFFFSQKKILRHRELRLLAQVTQLVELVPGFYCRDFVFNHYVTTAFCGLFVNEVTSRAIMTVVVYCLVLRKKEVLSSWKEAFCPSPCLLMLLLSLMVELTSRIFQCYAKCQRPNQTTP